MTLSDLLRIIVSIGLRHSVNSDGEVVVETSRPGPASQEQLIRSVGQEGTDFKCLRHRSGRSVTFHPRS